MILHGNCLDKLKTLKNNSIDSIVTDPPYGLAFMGKKWDYEVPSVEIWTEALRVLKPGGHLLSFGGTRTYHRMVVNIEDAGFEIRDQIMWIYGSGFPKSTDVSKRIDKEAGAEREVIGVSKNNRDRSKHNYNSVGNVDSEAIITAPATDSAKLYQGWGTALKPSNEPICVARKPLEKGLTVAANVLKYGTGGINIDGTRIGSNPGYSYKNGPGGNTFSVGKDVDGTRTQPVESTQGRWPANTIFDEAAAEMLDAQTQNLHGAGFKRDAEIRPTSQNIEFKGALGTNMQRFGDSGGASRFFYVAKASKSERNAGLEGMPLKESGGMSGTKDKSLKTGSGNERDNMNQNFHPTVKPIKLMQYLIKLVTPINGTVLDPFVGSGTTGVAAKSLGFKFIGCEMNKEYVEIAQRRIEHQESVAI